MLNSAVCEFTLMSSGKPSGFTMSTPGRMFDTVNDRTPSPPMSELPSSVAYFENCSVSPGAKAPSDRLPTCTWNAPENPVGNPWTPEPRTLPALVSPPVPRLDP